MSKASEKVVGSLHLIAAAPVFDGRMFGWQRSLTGVSPVVVCDKLHGCCARMEFVGDLHVMKPGQYNMTLEELELEYPAPEVKPE